MELYSVGQGMREPSGRPASTIDDEACARVWQAALTSATAELGADCVDQWIRPFRLVRIAGELAVVAGPTSFLADWVERNYGRHILRGLQSAVPAIRRIDVKVSPARADVTGARGGADGADDAPDRSSDALEAPARQADPARGWPAPGPRRTARTDPGQARPGSAGPSAQGGEGNGADLLQSAPLDPRFTFESFVVGKPNELAHAAARRVAESCDGSFNPVFLYGGVGLGKTHLMHAIGHHLEVHKPEMRVLYLSAEQFMYRFIQALRYRDTMTFKQQFRSVDVLMIDDVQFIAGKDSTQDEFFHTFNVLVDQKKQIVISGDRSPDRIDGMEDRIKSRLQWGLVVDIHPTDYELRLGILQQKAEVIQVTTPEVHLERKVLDYLAHRISSNVRVLEGALTRLFAFASLVGRPIDMEMTQECLADLLRSSERKVTIDDIKRKVCDHYNLRLTDLSSARRARTVARPRQVAMYLSKTLTPKSLPEIGRGFGGRDHTTVIHAIRKIEELRSTDAQLAEDIELLRRMLEA